MMQVLNKSLFYIDSLLAQATTRASNSLGRQPKTQAIRAVPALGIGLLVLSTLSVLFRPHTHDGDNDIQGKVIFKVSRMVHAAVQYAAC